MIGSMVSSRSRYNNKIIFVTAKNTCIMKTNLHYLIILHIKLKMENRIMREKHLSFLVRDDGKLYGFADFMACPFLKIFLQDESVKKLPVSFECF